MLCALLVFSGPVKKSFCTSIRIKAGFFKRDSHLESVVRGLI